jgi:ABC-type lipoprotein export system ATPase subunit
MARMDNEEGEKRKISHKNEGLIELTRVEKAYDTEAGKFLALRGVNLTINQGEFVGVIGKSGSGKSTLINMISGIDRPTAGEIRVSGTAIEKLSEGEMAKWRGKNLGIVFQFFQLLPTLTVAENVMLPMDFVGQYSRGERRKKAMEFLEAVEIAEQADKMPAQLSGGQQQRVAIARALANNPPIIVADEPTGNLDSKSAAAVFKLFEKLVGEGKTILMVTHDSDLARRVGRTLIISDGEIIEEFLVKAFPGLSEGSLKWVTKALQPTRYVPGQAIIRKGENIEKFYLVTQGKVEIWVRTKTGEDLVVATLGRGQFFGEIEMIKGGVSLATARAAGNGEEVEVARLNREEFDKLLGESKETKKLIDEVAAERLKENVARTGRGKR